MLIIIAVLAAIIGAGYFIGTKAVEEASDLINLAPDICSGFREDFREVEHNLNKFMKQLPENVQTSINNVQDDLGERIGKLVGNISEWTVGYAGDMAKHLSLIHIYVESDFWQSPRHCCSGSGLKAPGRMSRCVTVIIWQSACHRYLKKICRVN